MDTRTLQQERDMAQMRTDHELEVEGLLHEVERATIHGDIKGVVAAKQRLRASLRPLLDAAYGPLVAPARSREVTPITAWSKPGCLVCGAHVGSAGPFCPECDDALDCPECGGEGCTTYREPGTSGEHAIEGPCMACSGSGRRG